MGRGWLFGRGVRFREAVGCTAAEAGALPLVLASDGLCGAQAWFGGAAGCAAECADLCIGTRGRNIERQERGNSGKHSGLE